MTNAEIERLAREAGIEAVENVDYRRAMGQVMTGPEQDAWDAAIRFAALVEAAERERCAKVCDDSADDDSEQFAAAARYLADAIRAG